MPATAIINRPTPTASPATAKPSRPARKPASGVCSLALTINGTVYTLRKLPRDASSLGGWRLRKADGSGTVYRVVKDRWGAIACSCADDRFGHHAHSGECKHSRALRAVGLIAPQYRGADKDGDFTEAVV